MQKLLLLTTGGTIACEAGPNGLAPAKHGADLLSFLPARDGVQIDVLPLLQKDSTELSPQEVCKMAEALRQNEQAYDGFVLTHGTDTLAYSAALLYYLLGGFCKPVVLTGSMLPLSAPDSDAPQNLDDAISAALCPSLQGVYPVLQQCIFHPLTLTKQHSTARNAFVAWDKILCGRVQARRVLDLCPAATLSRSYELCDAVCAVVPVTPYLQAGQLLSAARGCTHLILQALGAGGLPSRLMGAVQALSNAGIRLYLTTQCPEGQADLSCYQVGRQAASCGVKALGAYTLPHALAAISVGLL